MAIPSQLIADWKWFSQLGCRSNAQGGHNIPNFAALFTAVINISGTTARQLSDRSVSLDSQLDPVWELSSNLVHAPAQTFNAATSHCFDISAGHFQRITVTLELMAACKIRHSYETQFYWRISSVPVSLQNSDSYPTIAVWGLQCSHQLQWDQD